MSFMTGTLENCALRSAAAIGLLILMLAISVFNTQGVLADDAGAAGVARLVPGDRIEVTVFGQAELSGVFQISGDGIIELPLVGAVPVGQLTLKESEKRIEARLADGYINRPAVSVRISELRPIYVIGDVKTPGAVAFRYGTSVLSAIAQAGGYSTLEPAMVPGAVAELLLAEERVRTLETTRRAQLIRIARLEAQRDGQTTFTLPNVNPASEEDRQLIDTVANERETLRSQKEALEQELRLQREQQPRLQSAYEGIEKQIEADKEQFALVQEQLNDMLQLRERGLLRRATEFALQREKSALQSNMARYRSELARLTVVVGEIDIKINDTQNVYMRRVNAELEDARRKLLEIDAVLPTAREVREVRLAQAGNAAGFAVDQTAPAYRLQLTRTVGSEVKTTTVTREALLLPGDIVEVTRVRPKSSFRGAGLDLPQESTKPRGLAAIGGAERQRSE